MEGEPGTGVGNGSTARVEQRILVYFCTTLVREIDLRAQRSTAVDR